MRKLHHFLILKRRRKWGGVKESGTDAPSDGVGFLLYEYLKPLTCSAQFEKIVAEYTVNGVLDVKIGVEPLSKKIIYCVSEPRIVGEEVEIVKLVSKLIEALTLEGYESLPRNIDELQRLCDKYNIDFDTLKKAYIELSYFVRKGLSGYGPLYPLIVDKHVEEIAVNRPFKPVAIVHRDLPIGWIETNIVVSDRVLDAIIVEAARKAGRSISLARPYLEALLPEGHRLSATFSREISRYGSSLVIRKHREESYTLPQLVRYGMLSTLIAAYLWFLLLYRPAMMIIGPTASGKTTLLQALLHLVPPYARIVTIEDTPELDLSFHPHWDNLVVRRAYESVEEDVDMYKLAIFALRRRPDYFIIGEVRGEEAKVFIHAAASGHAALTTFHADTVETAIYRLRAPPISIGDSFLQLLWAIVVVRRLNMNGLEVRRVVSVEEIVPTANGFTVNKVFEWNPSRSFAPDSVDELVSRSFRIKMIAEAYGLSLGEVKATLKKLAELLSSCISCSLRDFLGTIHSFYVYENMKRIGVERGVVADELSKG